MKVRFVHSDASLGNLTIRVDEAYIYGLGFGDITLYSDADFGRIVVYKGDVAILKRKIPHHEGMYTVVIAPKSDLVVYKDPRVQNEEGTTSLQFYHLGNTLPSVDILVDNSPAIKDLAYLQVKKTTINLGAPFHSLRVTSNGKNVLQPVMISPTNQSLYYVFLMERSSNPIPIVVNNLASDTLADNFSPSKYMGEWYLISEFPQPYEKPGCVNQKAIYTLLHNGVKVHNLCMDASGKVVDEIYGLATTPDKSTPAALRVDFPMPPGKPSPLPAGPNYLVHKVNYNEYSVVGSPNRSSFYILSRTPTMSKKRHSSLVAFGKELGYDMSKLQVMNNTII